MQQNKKALVIQALKAVAILVQAAYCVKKGLTNTQQKKDQQVFKIAKEFSFDMAHMLNGHDDKMNLLETITQLGQLNLRATKPKWQLSLQTHKIIGIE